MSKEQSKEKEKEEKNNSEQKETPRKRKPKNLEVEKVSRFQGSQKRKETMQQVLQICRESELPQPLNEMINKLSYKLGLTPRKIKDDYIDVLISVDVLQVERGQLELGTEEPNA